MLVRPDLGEPMGISLGRRTGMIVRPGYRGAIVGYHALDRTRGGSRHTHGAARADLAREVLKQIGDPTTPALVVGDLNDMYPQSAAARLIRPLGPLTGLLPIGEPGESRSNAARVGSLSQRLWAMTGGESLAVYGEAGFSDADPAHQPTMKFGPVAVQLDHILARGCETAGFSVIPAGGLSDHDMISARFSFAHDFRTSQPAV